MAKTKSSHKCPDGYCDTCRTKRCYKCRKRKPISDFYPRRDMYRPKDGYRSECKLCCSPNFDHWQQRAKLSGYKKPPEDPRKKKNRNLLRNHGITLEVYEVMVAEQKQCCAVCRRKRLLCVDHDHATGEIRGLLCHSCNRAVGMLKDDWRRAARMARYLKER